MSWKKGDGALCIKSYVPNKCFAEGSVYIVTGKKGYTENMILVERDDLGSTTNGWHEQFFIRIPGPLTELDRLLFNIV